MDIGTVVTLVTAQGEVVGRFEACDDHHITLSRPRLSNGHPIIVGNYESDWFSAGISVTGERDPDLLSFNLAMVLAVTVTDKSFAEKWADTTRDWVT